MCVYVCVCSWAKPKFAYDKHQFVSVGEALNTLFGFCLYDGRWSFISYLCHFPFLILCTYVHISDVDAVVIVRESKGFIA